MVAAVQDVAREYAGHLPLTARQIFYRLVGRAALDKTDREYDRLCEALGRARRAGLIPFDWIRDDGHTERVPLVFDGPADFWSMVEDDAAGYRRDPMADQPARIELWCEAGGMVPQLVQVAHPFGVPVYSSGGFDSLTAKHAAARRVTAADRPTVVLHVGDHDPSGRALYVSAKEDVSAFVERDCPAGWVEFSRVAVTPAQVERFGLPTSPPKKRDKRGPWQGGTVQAEALPPDALADIVREALVDWLDLDAVDAAETASDVERAGILDAVAAARRAAR